MYSWRAARSAFHITQNGLAAGTEGDRNKLLIKGYKSTATGILWCLQAEGSSKVLHKCNNIYNPEASAFLHENKKLILSFNSFLPPWAGLAFDKCMDRSLSGVTSYSLCKWQGLFSPCLYLPVVCGVTCTFEASLSGGEKERCHASWEAQ